MQPGVPQVSRLFRWSLEDSASTRTIRLHGELDLVAASQHRDDLLALVDSDAAAVVLAVEELSFADSTALRLFLDMKRIAEDRGKRFVLDGVSRPVARLLQVTGLTTHFS